MIWGSATKMRWCGVAPSGCGRSRCQSKSFTISPPCTYPFLPVVPVATVHLGREDPPLSPKQDEHPDGHEQVWKTQETARDQVSPEMPARTHGHALDYCP